MFGEKHLNYMLHAEPDLMILCDADKMQRVLDNLLRNAVYYSFEGSTVEIAAAFKEDAAVITVVNQGIQSRRKSWDAFSNSFTGWIRHAVRTAAERGLGLPSPERSWSCITGEITVQSKEERTTFEVTIPVS